MIELTKDEANVIAEFIDMWLFEAIREDSEIDNINWLKNMISVYAKCMEGVKNEEQL